MYNSLRVGGNGLRRQVWFVPPPMGERVRIYGVPQDADSHLSVCFIFKVFPLDDVGEYQQSHLCYCVFRQDDWVTMAINTESRWWGEKIPHRSSNKPRFKTCFFFCRDIRWESTGVFVKVSVNTDVTAICETGPFLKRKTPRLFSSFWIISHQSLHHSSKSLWWNLFFFVQ